MVPKFNVTGTELQSMLQRGAVIAHVDGNHFVRVLGAVEEGGSTWLQIYDSARELFAIDEQFHV